MLKNLKNLKNDKKGIVFILVISIIVVMMIIVISILSINTSQSLSTESEVKRIQAETLAMGGIAWATAQAANGQVVQNFTETIDGTVFSLNQTMNSQNHGLNIIVNY